MEALLIPIDNLLLDPNFILDHAYEYPNLELLVDSIRVMGIQNPLFVYKLGDRKYLIFDGRGRYQAAKRLKLTHLPCFVYQFDSGGLDFYSTIKNSRHIHERRTLPSND